MPESIIEAVYENGILRPVTPISGLAEHSRVTLRLMSVRSEHPLKAVIGILPDEDAKEILQIVNQAFGQVNPEGWK